MLLVSRTRCQGRGDCQALHIASLLRKSGAPTEAQRTPTPGRLSGHPGQRAASPAPIEVTVQARLQQRIPDGMHIF